MNKEDLLIKYCKRFPKFKLEFLTKEIAENNLDELLNLIDQIPLVNYTKEEIIAESKENGERIFYGKWEHSLILFDENRIVAVVMAYERKKENNDQYPENTLYLSELAVSKKYQRKGIAKNIVDIYLKVNKEIGFIYLEGGFNYSVQTNSAEWNSYVINLYKSFGFRKRAEKIYDNRVDLVMGLKYRK